MLRHPGVDEIIRCREAYNNALQVFIDKVAHAYNTQDYSPSKLAAWLSVAVNDAPLEAMIYEAVVGMKHA